MSILLLAVMGCNTTSVIEENDSNLQPGIQRSSPSQDTIQTTPASSPGKQSEVKAIVTEPVVKEFANKPGGVAKESNVTASLDQDSMFNLLAAEFAGNLGDVQTSINYYRKASEKIEDSRIAARSVYIALYGKDYDEALAGLKRWEALEPEAVDMPRVYAVTYLKLGQPDDAVPYIKKMLEGSHENIADEAMAVKLLLTKEASTEDSYKVLKQLNAAPEKNTHLLVLESRYAAQLKHYDESVLLLDEVLSLDPSLHEVLIIKARILVAQGKNDEAKTLLKQVLEELPDNDALRMQYARMLVEARELPAALVQYEVLHEKLPEDDEILLSVGLLYIETGQLEKAEDALQSLIDMDHKKPIANYYLGRIEQSRGEDKQAIAYYLRVTSGTYKYDAQLRIGVLLAVLGKTDEALAKLEALAEDQGDWSFRVKAYLAQGEILRKQKRYKEGVEMYSRALQQNRDDTTLLYARGLMAEKVDRLDMAEADFLKVIAIDPDNADALNALGYTLADRTARYQDALKYIKRAMELVPDDPAILDSLGWVSYRLGNMDEALLWLSRAFEKLEDAEIAAHYGEVLWEADQKDRAREIWEIGKKQNSSNPVLIETLKRINP